MNRGRAPVPARAGALLLAVLAAACAPSRPAGRTSASSGTASAESSATTAELRPATPDQLMAAVRAPGAGVVLLNAWASWCVPCREEFPDLMRIEREYRARGLRLVLVSTDFDTELPAVKRFLSDQGVGFMTYLKQGPDMAFIDTLDTRWSGALPATVLYDAGGRKLWFHEGKTSYDTLKTRVEAALAAAPPPGR